MARQRGHQFPLRRKGDLATTLKLPHPFRDTFQLPCRDEECRFGRVAQDLPVAVVLPELRVVGERAAGEHHAYFLEQGRIPDVLAVVKHATLRPVPDTSELGFAGGGADSCRWSSGSG